MKNRQNYVYSLSEVQHGLQEVTKSSIVELASFANPPLAITTLMQVVGIFLQPEIPSDQFTWTNGRKLLRKNDFIQSLVAFDKERITAEQIARTASFMNYEVMQPTVMRNASLAGSKLLAWVRAMYLYGQMKHQVITH